MPERWGKGGVTATDKDMNLECKKYTRKNTITKPQNIYKINNKNVRILTGKRRTMYTKIVPKRRKQELKR